MTKPPMVTYEELEILKSNDNVRMDCIEQIRTLFPQMADCDVNLHLPRYSDEPVHIRIEWSQSPPSKQETPKEFKEWVRVIPYNVSAHQLNEHLKTHI